MMPFVQRLQSTYSKINNLEIDVLYTLVSPTLSTWLVEKCKAHLWPSSPPHNIPKTFTYLQITPLIWTRNMISHNSINMSSFSLLYDCNFSHILLTLTVHVSINLLHYFLFVAFISNPCNVFDLFFFRDFWLIAKLVYLLSWVLDVLPGQKNSKQ